jgi:hypothetical protein
MVATVAVFMYSNFLGDGLPDTSIISLLADIVSAVQLLNFTQLAYNMTVANAEFASLPESALRHNLPASIASSFASQWATSMASSVSAQAQCTSVSGLGPALVAALKELRVGASVATYELQPLPLEADLVAAMNTFLETAMDAGFDEVLPNLLNDLIMPQVRALGNTLIATELPVAKDCLRQVANLEKANATAPALSVEAVLTPTLGVLGGMVGLWMLMLVGITSRVIGQGVGAGKGRGGAGKKGQNRRPVNIDMAEAGAGGLGVGRGGAAEGYSPISSVASSSASSSPAGTGSPMLSNADSDLSTSLVIGGGGGGTHRVGDHSLLDGGKDAEGCVEHASLRWLLLNDPGTMLTNPCGRFGVHAFPALMVTNMACGAWAVLVPVCVVRAVMQGSLEIPSPVGAPTLDMDWTLITYSYP